MHRTQIVRRLRTAKLDAQHICELAKFRSSLTSSPPSPRSPSILQRLEPQLLEPTTVAGRKSLPNPGLDRIATWADRATYDVRCVTFLPVYEAGHNKPRRFTLTRKSPPRRSAQMIDIVEEPVRPSKRFSLTFSPRVRFLSQIFKKGDAPAVEPRHRRTSTAPVIFVEAEQPPPPRPPRDEAPRRPARLAVDTTEIAYAVRPGRPGPLLPAFDPTPPMTRDSSFASHTSRTESSDEDDKPLATVRTRYAARATSYVSDAPPPRPASMYTLPSVGITLTPPGQGQQRMSGAQRDRMRLQIEAEQRERAVAAFEAERKLAEHKKWDRQLRRRSAAMALCVVLGLC
jgi:hypothetical protein